MSDQPFQRNTPWKRSRLVALLILAMLAIFLLAKTEFRLERSNLAFYTYGVIVTSVVFLQMLVSMLFYRDLALEPLHVLSRTSPRLSTATSPEPLVSCLLAVHNEERIIEQCLQSLLSQSYRNTEIIVVDDASTDRTVALLENIATTYPVTLVKLAENVGKKRALSAALLRATGDFFAFTDSDSVWAPDAIEKTVKILQRHPEVGAVSGHCRALNAERSFITKVQDTWYEGQFSVRKAYESVFGAVTCVSGPLAVFRREAIFNYIPAWEQDQFLGAEFRFATDRMLTGFVLMDAHTATSLKRHHANSPFLTTDYPWKPWRIVYSKSARAWTAVPETFSALIKQQVRWKKSFIRNMVFTGRFYWRRPLLPAVTYYLHIFFVFAGPLIAFRHLIYMPLRGNIESMILYLFGIVLIGSMFGLAFWRENPQSSRRWIYRPIMSLLSTIVLSWLIGYSLLTVKKMHWSRA